MKPEKVDITNGIDTIVLRSIEKAIEKNSKETFHVLNKFVTKVVTLSIAKYSLNNFKKYIFFYPLYYTISYEKQKESKIFEKLHRLCAKEAVIVLRDIIWIGLGFENKRIKDGNREGLNAFYYWAFTSYEDLFYKQVMNNDLQQFQDAINQFYQISGGTNKYNYESNYEINELKRQNVDGKNDTEIKKLEEKQQVFEAFDTYKRHALMGIKYWVICLYETGKLNIKSATDFLTSIKIPYTDSKVLLKDILFFRTNSFSNYMNWLNWGFAERPDLGEDSDPVDQSSWVTLGFIVELINKGHNLYVNTDDLDRKDMEKIQHLYNDLLFQTTKFEQNFEKWRNLLHVVDIETLKERYVPILENLAAIKQYEIGERAKEIAAAHLDEEMVTKFVEIIGEAWKKQAKIRRLFQLYENKILFEEETEELRIIGNRTFFENGKRMFINGPNHNNIMSGLEQMGNDIGRWEDSEFFNTIMKKNDQPVGGKSLLDCIDKALVELKLKNISATIILTSSQLIYKEDGFRESKRFKSKEQAPKPDDYIGNYYFGTLDDIPMYALSSNFIKNHVVICDFKAAFKMRCRPNPLWFEELLNVNVRILSKQEVDAKFNDNPEKWMTGQDGQQLRKDEALLLIQASVIIDIWSILDFQIVNKDAYVIGVVKNND